MGCWRNFIFFSTWIQIFFVSISHVCVCVCGLHEQIFEQKSWNGKKISFQLCTKNHNPFDLSSWGQVFGLLYIFYLIQMHLCHVVHFSSYRKFNLTTCHRGERTAFGREVRSYIYCFIGTWGPFVLLSGI